MMENDKVGNSDQLSVAVTFFKGVLLVVSFWAHLALKFKKSTNLYEKSRKSQKPKNWTITNTVGA